MSKVNFHSPFTKKFLIVAKKKDKVLMLEKLNPLRLNPNTYLILHIAIPQFIT